MRKGIAEEIGIESCRIRADAETERAIYEELEVVSYY
jgi:hypothetical protein